MIRLLEPEAEATSQVLALVQKAFAAKGFLTNNLGLEHRPQQAAMAQAVSETLLGESTLFFEAGTGVGKSLAYLIPGLIHAMNTGRPLVVSTHTRSLQHQIKHKDLELCRHFFEKTEALQRYSHFKVALLVGRRNYLCNHRLTQAINSHGELFPSDQQSDLERIVIWAEETKTGLIEELSSAPSPDVWEWVHADASTCNRKNCSPKTCFYRKARAELQEAQCIIVNHSLLFSLISAGATPGQSPGVLFPEDCLVLDEAHTAGDIATEHFGLHISSTGIERALKLLYNPRRKKGLLARHGTRHDCAAIQSALEASDAFFARIREDLLQGRDLVRLRAPGWAAPTLLAPLKCVVDHIGSCIQRAPDETAQEELKDHRARIANLHRNLSLMLDLIEEDHVHWVERGGHKGMRVTLRTAPIDIAPHLREHLFTRQSPVILTSATLNTGRSMEHLVTRLGAPVARTEQVDSPFDYERHLQIFIAGDAPEPTPATADAYTQYLAEMVNHCALNIEGGSLVLFTSYGEMQRVARLCSASFHENDRPFFVQGEGSPRSVLTERFKEAGNGILFGTDSFWTGVDVPGPALSQVIIARLPFKNPSHPLLEAKHEWIRDHGGSPFADMTLPDSLIQFRQGIGRLIRSQEDRGVLTLLDGRILKKPYGRQFISILPKASFTRITRENRGHVFPGGSFD